MAKREIPGSTDDKETGNKILDEATRLFALHGFGAVSMRDIAKATGIQMSTIYYYYENKEALLEAALSRFEDGYKHYFKWLKEENEKASSLEELMDNLFNKELLEIVDPIGRLGISLTMKEQHSSVSARNRVFELLLQYSIASMQADFDRLIEKGIIPPVDTKTVATIIMFYVMVINDLSLHEYEGQELPIDSKEIYGDLKKFIISALKQGS